MGVAHAGPGGLGPVQGGGGDVADGDRVSGVDAGPVSGRPNGVDDGVYPAGGHWRVAGLFIDAAQGGMAVRGPRGEGGRGEGVEVHAGFGD